MVDGGPLMRPHDGTKEKVVNTGRAVVGIAFVGIGVLLLLDQQDVVDAGRVVGDWQVVWPLGLVGAGLWLLLRRPVRTRGTATADEDIDVLALFSSQRVVCTTPRFRGGSATALFGGVEVDLTRATIDGEAVLEAVALFGGIDVKLGQVVTAPPPVTTTVS